MQFVPVRDFRVNPASVWDTLDANDHVVVTNHGRPTALMLKVDGESLMETLAAVEQAQWLTLLTKMQTQVAASSAQGMSDDEINSEIAAARAEV